MLQTILDTGGSLPQTLFYLEVVIRGFPLFKLNNNLETIANHIAWTMMRKYLAPDSLPNLRELGLGRTWVFDEDGDVDYEEGIQIASAISSMFLHSFPTWEGDGRGLKYWCTLTPHYDASRLEYC